MCENFCLETSSLTLSLKKDFCFISSFPGFLIFGSVCKSHYEKNKFFHFSHFDLPKLYAAVLKMIHFMADNAESIEKTEFLTKQLENSNISYYISANTNLNTKRVKFCLEVNSQVFELPLTYFELNDFLYCINDIIIACLCLKPIEKELIVNVISKPLEDLIVFQNFADAKSYITTMYEKTLCSALRDNMTTVLVHYNLIVIILHKFKTLVNPDILFQNNDQISSLITIDLPTT